MTATPAGPMSAPPRRLIQHQGRFTGQRLNYGLAVPVRCISPYLRSRKGLDGNMDLLTVLQQHILPSPYPVTAIGNWSSPIAATDPAKMYVPTMPRRGGWQHLAARPSLSAVLRTAPLRR